MKRNRHSQGERVVNVSSRWVTEKWHTKSPQSNNKVTSHHWVKKVEEEGESTKSRSEGTDEKNTHQE